MAYAYQCRAREEHAEELHEGVITLSTRAALAIVEALQNPPAPNQNALDAAKFYRDWASR
jgi:uncharacterized protein (DUF1778 family)